MKDTERRSRSGAKTWVLTACIILALLLGAGVLLKKTPNPVRGGRHQPPTAVQVAPTTRGDVPVTLKALGTVVANQSVTLTSMISGRLEALYFTEGQPVRQGQLLARIDTRGYAATKAQYQAQLAQDQAQLTNAQQTLARYRRLYADKSLALQDLQTQIATVGQYQGAVDADRAQIQAAQVNIDYGQISAPVSGYVGLRLIDAGNTVSANSTQLVTLTQTRPIAVTFSIPEKYLEQVRPAIRAGGSLPVLVLAADGEKTVASGQVRFLSNQIDSATGSVELKAIFANDDERLFPNQYVKVQLRLGLLKNAVIAPQAAIQLSDAGSYVYLVDSNNVVHRQSVSTGPSDGQGGIVVNQGLQPGQRVVTRGVDRLRDGAKVQTLTAGSDAATSP